LSAVLGAGVAAATLAFHTLGFARGAMDASPSGLTLGVGGVGVLAWLFSGSSSMLKLVLSWASQSPQPILSACLLFWEYGLGSTCPWAGKAFFAVSALVGMATTWMMGLFLEDPDPNGGLLSSWFNAKASIRRALVLLGVHLLMAGVSDTGVGVFLTVVVLFTPTVSHWANLFYLWRNRSHYRPANPLSEAEYAMQGSTYTQQALADLQHLPDDEWARVRKKLKGKPSRSRFQEFRKGGSHIGGGVQDRGGRGGCTVQ
ncbi:unnamed protein product, partial [Discosporangium mesarthrocarpum]